MRTGTRPRRSRDEEWRNGDGHDARSLRRHQSLIDTNKLKEE